MGDMGESEIPKKCKAGVVVNPGPDFHLEVQDVDVPEPGPTEILIRLNVTGLCMSDVHYMLKDLGAKDRQMDNFGVRSPGHEGAGVVVKLGSEVKDWKIGDRAGIKPRWDVCRNCEQCWNSREQYCPNAITTGRHKAGTYQQYLTSPALYASRIPDGVPDEVAGPIMCAASTMHRALIDSGLKSGNWVVFPGGGGGVGTQGVQLAKAMGMRPIVVDSGEAKEALAMRVGAEAFVDFRKVDDVAAKVVEVADGIGAHGVLVTAWQTYKDAVSYVGRRIGSVVMCIGLPPDSANVSLGAAPYQYASLKLNITGSLVGTMQDTAAALEYARRGMLQSICEVRGLGAFPESVQQLKRSEVPGRIVIDFNKP